MLSHETLPAAIHKSHRSGKMTIAHATTYEATQQAILAGIKGLARVFVDRPHTPDLVAAIAASGAFVTPCLSLNSSVIDNAAAALAANKRLSSRLRKQWLDSLCRSSSTYPQGNLDGISARVRALQDAGVDVQAGTAGSEPPPCDRLAACAKELPSYEVPEILALPIIRGSEKYLDWFGGAVPL